MPISIDIQNKVLKVAANKAVDSNVRLAVRKQFYLLKGEEIDLESVQEQFNAKVSQFGAALDKILKENSTNSVIATVEAPQEEIIEEIVVPKKEEKGSSGVKVRMQEELDNSEEDTDFEVPFEVVDYSIQLVLVFLLVLLPLVYLLLLMYLQENFLPNNQLHHR